MIGEDYDSAMAISEKPMSPKMEMFLALAGIGGCLCFFGAPFWLAFPVPVLCGFIWGKKATILALFAGLVAAFSLWDPISILQYFRWLVVRGNREEIDLVVTNLKKDKREMRHKGYNRFLVNFALLWHVVRTIVAFSWDRARTVASKLIPFAKYFSRRD